MSFFSSTPKTVDDAIAGLLKAQADLQTVAENRKLSAVNHRIHVAELQARADADEAEAVRAQTVLAKLLDITGG